MSDTATVTAPQPSAPAPTTNTTETKPEVKTQLANNKPAETKPVESEIKKETNPDNPDKPFVLKVDGKEIHLSKEEAVKWAQKGMGADKKFNEAHKMRVQAEQFIRVLRENPEAILMNPQIMGQERFRKLAQDFLHKEIQKEMMTPEQRELAEIKEKLAREEQEKKELLDKQHEERQSELVKHYNEQYEKDITETLKTAGLPKTRSTVKRIAYYLSEGLKKGIELKVADVIDIVRTDYNNEIKELYGQLDGETLAQFLGEENLKKIREAELKKLGRQPEIQQPSNQPSSDNGEKKLDKDEWRKMMDEKYGKI